MCALGILYLFYNCSTFLTWSLISPGKLVFTDPIPKDNEAASWREKLDLLYKSSSQSFRVVVHGSKVCKNCAYICTLFLVPLCKVKVIQNILAAQCRWIWEITERNVCWWRWWPLNRVCCERHSEGFRSIYSSQCYAGTTFYISELSGLSMSTHYVFSW